MTKSKEAPKHMEDSSDYQHNELVKKSYEAIAQAMTAAKAKDSELFAKYKSELAEIRVVAEKKIGVTLTNDQCLAYVMHWFRGHMAEVEQ